MDEEFKNVVLKETDENTDAQTVEENEEGIELTDTIETETPVEEKEEDSRPQGRYVTDEEIDKIVDRRVARKMSKWEREREKDLIPYREAEAVLNAGLGTSNIQEATKKVRESYEEQGVKIPEFNLSTPRSQREEEILAKADANDIIEDGLDAMIEEANRLSDIGYSNLSNKDKVIFNTLAEKITEEKNKQGLKKIGVSEEILKDKDFVSFKKKFAFNTPIEEIYGLYKKTEPKPKVEKIGSMKNNKGTTVKDFYTYEEASKITREELDKNPELVKAIEMSMSKW